MMSCNLRLSVSRLASVIAVLAVMAGAALADINILLIKGKRTVKDKVSFTIQVDHEKEENPRYAKMPEFIQINATFASPSSGVILLDGKGVDRFDESVGFRGNRTEITYGRHVVTLQVSSPAVVTSLEVSVRGGVVREIIGEEPARPAASAIPATSGGIDERISALEQRVKQLEAEVESLKRGRRNQ